MSAKTYCKKTAAFAGFLIQNVPADLDDETMDNWMANPDATKKFLAGLKPQEKVATKPAPLFSVVATTNLVAVAGKKTAKCFVGSIWYPGGRDSDFDSWSPANQAGTSACVVTALAPSRSWTFVEAILALPGIIKTTDVTDLGQQSIVRGYTMTLTQAEEMTRKTEQREATGLVTNGYGNFFLTETDDPRNPVSVGYVLRVERGWCASLDRLDCGFRWQAGRRLLVRNLDASKL